MCATEACSRLNVYVEGNVVPVGVEEDGATDVGGCWWCSRTDAHQRLYRCCWTVSDSESLAASKRRLQTSSVVRWSESPPCRRSVNWACRWRWPEILLEVLRLGGRVVSMCEVQITTVCTMSAARFGSSLQALAHWLVFMELATKVNGARCDTLLSKQCCQTSVTVPVPLHFPAGHSESAHRAWDTVYAVFTLWCRFV